MHIYCSNTEELCDVLSSLSIETASASTAAATTTTTTPTTNVVENSKLNPLAAEFIPAISLVPPTTT